jgi:DNA-binding response OmpR family regulator
MNRILIVEDDPAILRGLSDNLAYENYDVITATDGDVAKQLIERERPDLIVLDVMLPKVSGYEVCRQARAGGVRTPILMLTARGDEADRIIGLDLGADDYVTKPFSVGELLARIRALLRRTQEAATELNELTCDDIAIDFRRYEARRAGRVIEMTPKEFGILRYLASRPGVVVRRDELLNAVWGYESTPTTRTIDNHILSLRAKLETTPSAPRHLLTIHAVGYKWQP